MPCGFSTARTAGSGRCCGRGQRASLAGKWCSRAAAMWCRAPGRPGEGHSTFLSGPATTARDGGSSRSSAVGPRRAWSVPDPVGRDHGAVRHDMGVGARMIEGRSHRNQHVEGRASLLEEGSDVDSEPGGQDGPSDIVRREFSSRHSLLQGFGLSDDQVDHSGSGLLGMNRMVEAGCVH